MSRRNPVQHRTVSQEDAQDALVRRARKARADGDPRRAATLLREACLRDESCAWLWTLYGAVLAEKGAGDDAKKALRHALWLRKSAGDLARVRSTERVIEHVGMRDAA